MNIIELTVHELQEKLKNKEITTKQIVEAYANRIEEKEKDVQAFVTTLVEEAKKQANDIQAKKRKRRNYRRFCRNTNRNKRQYVYKRDKDNM